MTKEFVKIQRPKLHNITTLREYSEVEGKLWMNIHSQLHIRTCSQVESSLESMLSFGPCGGCRSQTCRCAQYSFMTINPLPFALDHFRHPRKRARATIVARKRLDFNCPFWREARTLLQLLPIIGKLWHRRLIVWSGRSPVIFFGTNRRRLSSLG